MAARLDGAPQHPAGLVAHVVATPLGHPLQRNADVAGDLLGSDAREIVEPARDGGLPVGHVDLWGKRAGARRATGQSAATRIGSGETVSAQHGSRKMDNDLAHGPERDFWWCCGCEKAKGGWGSENPPHAKSALGPPPPRDFWTPPHRPPVSQAARATRAPFDMARLAPQSHRA